MKAVLDTSAIIYLNDFRMFGEMFTVSEVIEEVKDKITALKLSGIKLKIVEPSGTAINEIKSIAKELGDLEKLSKTDIKVLALAKEHNLTIISDDYNVQNIAEKCGIGYVSLFTKKIKELIFWTNHCKSCDKSFDNKATCLKCGSQLIRRPKKSIKIS